MAAVSEIVLSPDGRRWVVRRRWITRLGADSPWGRVRRRFRGAAKRAGDLPDVDPGCLELLGEGIAAVAALIAVVLLLVFVVIPFLVVLVDLVVLLVLGALGMLARVIFRRPWVVEARCDDGTLQQWKVVGWRASGEWCAHVAQQLKLGDSPPL